ncbi:MAG: 2-oxoacid:acceptor oxidoreductase subunit alpha [Limnochordia bacterium]|jgi:2-oxoglutarate ferredoxin oxidoreductase subunit alpha|nr:2-oxoacid:acceptor oxidoreductase subunit alpha [Bacillota bacterium]HOB08932.1 2-oxoacid:acceptor oxidoreductase subunit alpha [Limnochordia bacterium]NLH31879.1 2-oxoacid:acceptor oxidoreductase subunit alpha [Bacillota bacterium]HPT93184.1 2-oxoacid:acceptor oxidoreductase subunit alpha [Limnochordia bacterium]HPZ31090.1 2-oxoacid:acceptor oxidoreductase subunit alpha [Limnochordia bacterium]
MQQLTWKVGGAQGEGIDSTGEILGTVLCRLGYHTFAYRHFMSLIKGGHTNYKIRVADRTVHYHGDLTDILIAFDQRTIDENREELHQGSIVIHDAAFEPQGVASIQTCAVPMRQIAEELGNAIIKNMVAIGVTAAALNLDPAPFLQTVATRFAGKGEKIIAMNNSAIQQGYDYYRRHEQRRFSLPTRKADEPLILISGNEAAGFGALAGGCRFLAAYPITPATEIMYWLVNHLPDYGGKVVQVEDEIGACLMAVGASYAGVRAMTSTSGPGFSLMQEAIGFAGIAEIPIVIVDVQRGGPATGLPTRTEQSDLNEILYGAHGEIPRIVMAPATITDCFYRMIDAFNLAEHYQCVVIVATDMFLGMSKQSAAEFDFNAVKVERSGLISDESLTKLQPGTFKRYALTESGISPRSLPGQANGMYVALSNEHDEHAREEVEDRHNRITQMQKRFRKLSPFSPSQWGTMYSGCDEPDLLLVGCGSTYAQLSEARLALEQAGKKVAHLHLQILAPFPKAAAAPLIAKAQKCLVVDNNFTGQLGMLLKREIGFHHKYISHNRYDGLPLTVVEITEKASEVLS